MRIEPYLYFDGTCAEALATYARILGVAAPELMRYDDAPGEACASGETGRIMHGCLDLGGGHLMASDVPSGTPLPDAPHAFLNLAVDSVDEADRIFAALSDGGTVRVPMAPSFFAERFGMLVDRFGTGWMVLHTPGCGDAGVPEQAP